MSRPAENDALPNGCCHPPADHSAHVRHTAELDALANEMIACGAMFAALMPSESVEVVSIVENEDTAALVVRFPFLKSPYRITVTMEPDEGVIPPGERKS